MEDYSFLKLYTSISEALNNENPSVSITNYTGFVVLSPYQTLAQTTNVLDGIAFGGNIQVDLVDECGNVVRPINLDYEFFYHEFTNSVTGKPQIHFALGMLCDDYGEVPLLLRLKHTVSDSVWYSVPFLVTDTVNRETIDVVYKSTAWFRGIDYSNANYFQRIRLACFKDDIDPQTESEEVTQLSGNRYYMRNITTPVDKFKFYMLDFFGYNRLVTLLSHPIIYINGRRYTSSGQNASKGERVVDSNFFEATFTANPTQEIQVYQNEIFVDFGVTGYYPDKESTQLPTLSNPFTVTFNRPITVFTGCVAKLYEDGVLVATVTPTANVNVLEMDFSAVTFTNANYSIEITPNKVQSDICPQPLWDGVYLGEWEFNIANSTITVTTPKTISFTRSTVEVADPDLAPYLLDDTFVFDGYVNSASLPYAKIKILSLPTNGKLVNNGVEITAVGTEITASDITSGLFAFYPTGLANTEPFVSYNFGFNYEVYDTGGNVSNVVVVNGHFETEVTILTNPFGYDYSKTNAQITNPATAYETLTEAMMYYGYASGNEYPYSDCVILSLPDHGTITVNGSDITAGMLPFTLPLAEIADGNFAHWATGSDGSQPFATYTTNFTYKIKDTANRESEVITFIINFTALP